MNIEEQYLKLLQKILDYGTVKSDRTGTGTISLFGEMLEHDMSEGFPLLTTKKVHFKGIVTELLWFLNGDTNIKYLIDNGCNIWNGDCYKAYKQIAENQIEPNYFMHVEDTIENKVRILTEDEFIDKIKTNPYFANQFGDLGAIYGKQWRDCKGAAFLEGNTDGTDGSYIRYHSIDQISNLINDLKNNPDSRRMLVNAWQCVDLPNMTLPPCHYAFQVYTKELTFQERLNIYDPKGLYHNEVDSCFLDKLEIPKCSISLMWMQRSVDTFLGLCYNIASYAILLELLGKEVNMIPDKLKCCLGDVHLYSNHVEQAKLQLTRTPRELPKLKINFYDVDNFGNEFKKTILNKDTFSKHDFEVIDYNPYPAIKAPLSN